MIRGIKFVGIPVRDQDVSLKFYTEQLGCKVVTDQPFGEGQPLDRTAYSGRGIRPGAVHTERPRRWHWPVSVHLVLVDVFATAKALKSKGVTFAAEPKAESWGTSAIFKDPDGNQFVLGTR
jgi:catechol 2,3-dioxygenase-like lactoylglutathione lyase family enzyme